MGVGTGGTDCVRLTRIINSGSHQSEPLVDPSHKIWILDDQINAFNILAVRGEHSSMIYCALAEQIIGPAIVDQASREECGNRVDSGENSILHRRKGSTQG